MPSRSIVNRGDKEMAQNSVHFANTNTVDAVCLFVLFGQLDR